MPTQLQATVQRVGNYSYLCLENVAFTGQPLAQRIQDKGFYPPPLNQDMLGNPPTATAPAGYDEAHAATVVSSPWAGYFLAQHQRNSALAANGARAVTIEAPSIDETDIDWYATLNDDMDNGDPFVFTPGASIGASRYGRSFRVGDYVLILDDHTYVDADGVNQYSFEIAQLAAISAGGSWTLNRAGPASAKGDARFATRLVPHFPAGVPIRIYRLLDQFWSIILASTLAPQCLKLPWDNMCVAAAELTAANMDPLLLRLMPSAAQPAVPGFRTLSGAEYTLGDPEAVTLGGVSVLRLKVAAWHSIRNYFFELDGAAGTGADTEITLAYITPTRDKAYQIATFVIPDGERESYASAQQNTRFPTGASWPPHANLPLMVDGLDADGKLQNGFTLDLAQTVTMQEDGEIDYIVTSNATVPGVGLRGTVQT